ncbi:gas vesicle protein [Streptomyces sp. NPDC008313]|uniref:gas vesicle protein GvpO n=1 Tax=Streptomyces sp. NPDC008313 TaxID=3364826 RepID=UPI0036E27324
MSNTSNTSKTPSSRNAQNTRRSRNSAEPQNTHDEQDQQDEHGTRSAPDRRGAPADNSTDSDTNSAAGGRPKPMEVLRHARAQLSELTGMVAESVSSFERTEDGWALEVEVVELEKIPDTMSLLASYQVELDADGELTGYRRVRRYERGRAESRRSGGR